MGIGTQQTTSVAIPRMSRRAVALAAIIMASPPLAMASVRPRDGLPVVLTSIAPVADIVRQVGGTRIEIVQAIPNGADPHTYEPRPSDARRVADADIVILNGLNLEPMVERFVGGARRSGTPIVLLGDRALRPEDHAFDRSYPRSRGVPNPHAWMNPVFAKAYAVVVADELAKVAPTHADYYATNAKAFADRCDRLDAAIVQVVATIPASNRKMLTFHDSWPYWAQRYGLDIIGAIQASSETEPSPRELAALIDQVRQYRPPAIFGSVAYPTRVLDAIARETGVSVVDTLSDDDLPGRPGDAFHTYLGMMVSNMRELVPALGGTSSSIDGVDVSPSYANE